MKTHTRRKRIAFLGRGGHTLPTYRALLNEISKNYEVVVYSEVPVQKEWLELEHTYVIKSVPQGKYYRRIRELFFLGILIRDHLRLKFDLVHAHSTYPTGFAAVFLQRIFGVPSIVSLHAAEGSALPEIAFGDLLHPKRTKINTWVINHAKIVTALSSFQREEVQKNLGIKREILVTSRGVDLTRFFFERTNDIAHPVVFLSVGYLNPIKDPQTLLQTFFQVQRKIESRLILVGADYTNGMVKSLAEELGILEKITFAGFIDHDLIHEYYRKSDVLMHTSLYESQGMVVAEAMASGTLVCGTRVGLMSDLSGQCCITVSPKNPEALATSILELLGDQKKMKAMRDNAYAWSKVHSLTQTSEEITKIYQRLIYHQ